MINPLKNDVGARHTTLMCSHLSSTLMSTEWMLSSTPIEVEVEVMDPFCFSFTRFIVVLYLLKKEYFTAAHISKVTPGHRTVSNIIDTKHKEVP